MYQLFNLTRHPTISRINIYLEKKCFFLLDMMIWVWYYLKPKHSVNFLVFQWDKGISKKNSKKLVRGAIRLPITFLRLNTMLKGKKQWMHGFGKPKHSVNLLVFRRDKGISRKSYKKLVRGAIRLPIAFLRLNTMLKGKKQRKVALIMKLAISNFSCPAETHITNFTRLPHQLNLTELMLNQLKLNQFNEQKML